MNWLITGGCGFIGSRLVRALITNKKNNIRIIDNLSVGKEFDLPRGSKVKNITDIKTKIPPQGLELVVGNILDEELTCTMCYGSDVIVHLAANTGVGPSVTDPRHDLQINVLGTFNMLEAAKKNGVRRFIFASSGAPLGDVEPPMHEELPTHPKSPYGASKLSGEAYCSSYFHSFQIDTVSLRFGNVYGPGSFRKNSVVAKFIRSVLNDKPLEIYGNGNQTRDFIFVDDLVDAIMKAATTKNIGGETFQIATNNETTVSKIADLILQQVEERGIGIVDVIKTTERIGDVKRNFSDITKAQNILNWNPSVSLQSGISQTLDYYLDEQLQ